MKKEVAVIITEVSVWPKRGLGTVFLKTEICFFFFPENVAYPVHVSYFKACTGLALQQQ